MVHLDDITKKVLAGTPLDTETALLLAEVPLEMLCKGADQIRRYFCGDTFDMCSIVNARSGRCPEDCKFCAQSLHYHTSVEEYPLLDSEKILARARTDAAAGVHRFSIVISGRSVAEQEINRIAEIIYQIKTQIGIPVCASLGLLKPRHYSILRSAGLDRIHNNLETSARFFPFVCTTHSYEEKIQAIQAAQEAGFFVCSGGIIGLGETMEDRIQMACTLRDLGIRSIPINVLDPIPGTPYERKPLVPAGELQRVVAIFRYIIPHAFIRLAGGRRHLSDKGEACFRSGANAVISGDMLTTTGISIASDRQLLQRLGFRLDRLEEHNTVFL
ncbi:MAG: biotin synthase BioB [Treponemataceae bacterium]|nr:biotin synthase BioB [Treponemataceae bacterium]